MCENAESIFFKVSIFQNICKRYSKITAVSYRVQVPFCARLFKGQSHWDWKKYNLLSNLNRFLWGPRSSLVHSARKDKNMLRKASPSAACATGFYINIKATTEERFRLIDGDLPLNNAQGCMNRQQMSLWLVMSGTASSDKHRFSSLFAFMPASANHGIKYKWKPTFIKRTSLANACSSAGVLNQSQHNSIPTHFHLFRSVALHTLKHQSTCWPTMW